MARITGILLLATASVAAPVSMLTPYCLAQSAPSHLPPAASLGAPEEILAPGKVSVGDATLQLPDLIRLALEQSPGLAKAGYTISAAQGRWFQAGLYPNPRVGGVFDEIGDPQGPGGINTAPQVIQEIVTMGKLRLNQAVAQGRTDQARLALQYRRMQLITEVRKSYFRVLAIQKRIDVLHDLLKLASQSYERLKVLQKFDQASPLQVLPFRIERKRLIMRLNTARQQHLAARRQLAVIVGAPQMPIHSVAGSLDGPFPTYEFEQARNAMLQRHPGIAAARVGITRAEFALRRAEVEKYPNVTVGAGYVRQNQNGGDDWMIQFEFPLPVFDRNQGNVLAAQAEVGEAIQHARSVEYNLLRELSDKLGRFAVAHAKMEGYKNGIVKDAETAYQLSLQAFKGGQFEYLRVLTAQREMAEVELEYIKALSEAWQAASDVAALLQEDGMILAK